MTKLTDEEFVKALKLSSICTKKHWQFEIDKKIANLIRTAEDKSKMIDKIQRIIETDNGQEVLQLLDKINL